MRSKLPYYNNATVLLLVRWQVGYRVKTLRPNYFGDQLVTMCILLPYYVLSLSYYRPCSYGATRVHSSTMRSIDDGMFH
jgi:hypothetical protein